MSALFNDQPILGVRLVSDGQTIFNSQPVIGIVATPAALFVKDLRTLGVDILPADKPIHNDRPVIGAVVIGDGRALYNGQRVIPARAISGAFP